MAHLVQLLLPVTDAGAEESRRAVHDVIEQLTRRFGGATAYTRSPATGLWRTGRETERDTVIMVEVAVETLDRGWWEGFRRSLELRFAQEEIHARAFPVELI